MPISNQIRQLLQSKEFELALHLAVSFDFNLCHANVFIVTYTCVCMYFNI